MTEIAATQTPIQKFYSGSSIFISGGTGFLGTILIEKLLRSCPDISTIYLLARTKKGKHFQSRLDELFDDSVFDRLKNEFPKFRYKIVGISGDCSLPDLGISLQDRQMLINEVSILFHVAATVRFDEKLKIAVAINIRGTQEMLNLAKEMKNLKSFVHVSTAYSHVPNKIIDETFYPAPLESRKIMLLTETIPDHILEKITPAILDKWPNTYTFTKAIAEDLIREEGQNLPIAIFRPSIIVSTYQEPIPAWINNLYGPTGVVAGAGSGLLRTLHANRKVNANIVPVDMCANSLIALAWDLTRQTHPQIPIVHFESSTDQPLNWGEFMKLSYEHGQKTPSIKSIWYFCFFLRSNYFTNQLTSFFLHILPALLVDIVLICMGKAPKMLKIYKKIHKFTSVISYFSTRTWIFKSKNNHEMIFRMDEKDQQLFFCNLKQLDWNKFFCGYARGVRIYLLQDPIETLEEAKIRWRKLYWLHQAVKLVTTFVIVRLLWWFISCLIF